MDPLGVYAYTRLVDGKGDPIRDRDGNPLMGRSGNPADRRRTRRSRLPSRCSTGACIPTVSPVPSEAVPSPMHLATTSTASSEGHRR